MICSARAYTIILELSTDDGRTYTQTPKTLLGDVGDAGREGLGRRPVGVPRDSTANPRSIVYEQRRYEVRAEPFW